MLIVFAFLLCSSCSARHRVLLREDTFKIFKKYFSEKKIRIALSDFYLKMIRIDYKQDSYKYVDSWKYNYLYVNKY